MKKNILIIDDSALMRRVISDIINSDDRFQVKNVANDGMAALDLLVKNRSEYDAVLLDINMPKLNGLELLSQLNRRNISLKIIMVSTVAKEGAKETITALERGAFDFVTKPENFIETKGQEFRDHLIDVLCAATNIHQEEIPTPVSKPKLERITQAAKPEIKQETNIHSRFESQIRPAERRRTDFFSAIGKGNGEKLVAVACSTGGPRSLQSVIPKLPKNIDAPIVLVQHMPKGFTLSLAARLDELSEVKVKEAEHGDVLEKGHVYIAPGGKHMEVKQSGNLLKISLNDDPPVHALRPCANVMYESLADLNIGEITCVVLTGMGMDGTDGIDLLSKTKKIYVIGQDEATSVVYGMPKAVAVAGLVDEVVPLDRVAEAITNNVGVLNNGR